MAERPEQRIHQAANQKHSKDVPGVAPWDPVERIFDDMNAADEPRRRDADDRAQNSVKEKQ